MELRKSDFFNCSLSEYERKYLFEIFLKVTQISSMYGWEKEILDFISQEIENISNTPFKIHRNDEIGLFVFIPSKNCEFCLEDEEVISLNKISKKSKIKKSTGRECQCKNSVLFIAHCDTVVDYSCEPQFFKVKVTYKKKKYDREIVEASYIDNRLHVAILLTMIRFHRYVNTKFIAYFSVMEENGTKGAEKFVKSIDLEEDFKNIVLREIVVLDVCDCSELIIKKNDKELFGNESWDELQECNRILDITFSEEDGPKIGHGICDIVQEYKRGRGLTKTDGVEFCAKPYEHIPKIRYGCCCFKMHEVYSYCSISDMFDMYFFLCNGYEIELERRLKKAGKSK